MFSWIKSQIYTDEMHLNPHSEEGETKACLVFVFQNELQHSMDYRLSANFVHQMMN